MKCNTCGNAMKMEYTPNCPADGYFMWVCPECGNWNPDAIEATHVPTETLKRWREVISNVDAVSGDDELLFLGREIDDLLKEGKE